MPERSSEHEPSSARNIYAFGITSFLNDTASEMAYWVLPAFLASLGAGPAQLGLIEGVAESVASFAKLFSGYLTDRIDRRKPVVVAGYFAANAVKPLLAVATAWWHILLIRFTDRLAKGVRGAPRDVMVAESVPKHKLGAAYGLIQSMDSAGAIAGPVAALVLLSRFGIRGVFWPAAIPGALCLLAAMLGIREAKRAGGRDSAASGSVPNLGASKAPSATRRSTVTPSSIDALCQSQHDVKSHVLRPDIGDLLPFDVRTIFDCRDRSKHGVDRHRPRGVACLHSGSRHPSDRAACGQDHDVRQAPVLRNRSQGTA